MPHPLAGKPAPASVLVDVERLTAAYYDRRPNLEDPEQLVAFGTSGHRGSSFLGSFNEAHILAVTQALCEYRKQQGIDGPLLMGKDTHGLSGPAERTALEVLAANGVTTVVQRGGGHTPTPVISHAILTYNRGRTTGLADGIVITPSHNPPEDGGFKYNPPNGGPADTDVTGWIQDRANALLRAGNVGREAHPLRDALQAPTTPPGGLRRRLRRRSRERARPRGDPRRRDPLGVDPLGGAALAYWEPIADALRAGSHGDERRVDPTFALHDPGSRRQDPHGLLEPVRDGQAGRPGGRFQVAFGNDADADRHGIVTPSRG